MNNKEDHSNSKLLQIAVVGLAVVSLFTTARGMSQYIFNNDAIAYAASAAIQGILLSLNMNLPGYLKKIWGSERKTFFNFIIIIIILALTFLIMFSSSWFSYVYIAEVVHAESWETDSELLVQQTYRTELYNAQDYAYAYRIRLEEDLGQKLLSLEKQADSFSQKEELDNINIDWEAEKNSYGDTSTTAGNYMTTVIDAMNNAIGENASPNSHELAIKAVQDAQNNINSRMENIQQELDGLNNRIEEYNNRVNNLTRSINNAVEGTNTQRIITSLNTNLRQIEDATNQQSTLQEEYNQLDTASMRLDFYESRLGLTDSSSSVSIRNTMRELQEEFFRENPDEEKLLDMASDIFTNLRNAASYNSNDNLIYTELLVQMNQFILNLKDYSNIKAIERSLEDLMEKLRDAETTEEDTDEWNKKWRIRLEQLKSYISSMPMYISFSETEENNSGENMISSSQDNILSSYDRTESSNHLDNMIRLYTTKHSALYQGIIYLQSPYQMLALFSLFLAFSFDLSGFIFGFVIQAEEIKDSRNYYAPSILPCVKSSNVNITDTNEEEASWSIISPLNIYYVLTGDYKKKENFYIYDVFVNGLPKKWTVEAPAPYKTGIYIRDKAVESKGTLVSQTEQELRFLNQEGGPQDGIYLACSLTFNEGSLCIIRMASDGEGNNYLTNINEYVPVHIYQPKKKETLTIPAHQLSVDQINAQITILALNDKGTCIAAIYMIQS